MVPVGCGKVKPSYRDLSAAGIWTWRTLSGGTPVAAALSGTINPASIRLRSGLEPQRCAAQDGALLSQ